MKPIFLTVEQGHRIALPADLNCLTTYVILEQERWFEHEIDFLERWLQPGMRCLDIGANFGVYALLAAARVGQRGRVDAFEPTQEVRRYLSESARINAFAQLHIHAEALSSTPGRAWLKHGESSELNALETQETAQGEWVSVTTLDDFLSEYDEPGVDFVKIDAEGQEEAIIQGGQGFFSRHSPLIMYEFRHQYAFVTGAQERLEALGYGSYRLLGDGSMLIPASGEPDVFDLNRFALKPDRAAQLMQRGLLADNFAPHVPDDAARHKAISFLLALPYAQAFEFSPDDLAESPMSEVLIAHTLWRDESLAPNARLAALGFALEQCKMLCEARPGLSRNLTLARIAYESGERKLAFDALNQLAHLVGKSEGRSLDEPFVPPAPCFEAWSDEIPASEWLYIAMTHQKELLSKYSGAFGKSSVDGLRVATRFLPTASAARRRLILQEAKFGQALPDFSPQACSRLNPDYWKIPVLLELMNPPKGNV